MISKNALQNVLADTTQCAGFSIRRASRAVAQLYDRTLAPSGLKGTQFSLLSAIALTGNKSINQLAQLVLMDRTTLTRNLRPLQNQKLVQIKANSNDQRSKILQITAKGANKLQQALPLWKSAQTQISDLLGNKRLITLQNELELLESFMQE